jgi:mRNA interferase RelE/StbE
LVWEIKLTDTAKKKLEKLDPQITRQIIQFLRKRIALLDDPRSVGKALKGSVWGSYWRYRIGDYRLICDIQDGELCILVIEIGHRKDVYF